MMKYILLGLTILFASFETSFSQSKTLQELKDSNAVQLHLFFTPSTLRMLNLQKDPAYNEMVRGVDKLHFYMMNPTEFTTTDYFDTAEKLLKEEAYEEFIIWDGDGDEFQVLGKPAEQEMIGLASYAGRHYIFSLQGTIDLMKLPEIYEKMSTQDSTMNNGLSYIVDMIKREDENRIRHEKRRKEWEEKKKKEAEVAQIKTDSIRQDSLKNTIGSKE